MREKADSRPGGGWDDDDRKIQIIQAKLDNVTSKWK